jgi:hypothetical protein
MLTTGDWRLATGDCPGGAFTAEYSGLSTPENISIRSFS